MNDSILETISPQLLVSLTDGQSFSRGKAYFEEGRVSEIRADDDRIVATVQGSNLYRVELCEEDGALCYSCSCPFYEDTASFCKHCVAVALAAIQQKNEGGKKTKSTGVIKKETYGKAIETYLKTLDKGTLVSMLLHYSDENEELQSQLFLKASAEGKNIDFDAVKKIIGNVVDYDDFVDYRSMYQYAQDIRRVIDSLREFLNRRQAETAIELAEYFLSRIENKMGMVDDSNGHMGDILSELQEFHHEACVIARPDPIRLARKLFDWEIHSEWEVFYGTVTNYADVLGERGLTKYQALAEKEWEKVRALKPGEDRYSYADNRFCITSIMEELAERTGDVDKLVAVKMKDLSIAYKFLEIAELYKKAGNDEKALEWAEKGLEAFPQKTDSRLREFLAAVYHERNLHSDAMHLIWAEFNENPYFEQYKILKRHAEQAGGVEEWELWRDKALQLIRDRCKKEEQKSKPATSFWYNRDRSELVKIFLWEDDIDTAWKEAQEGECNESLWIELALKREKNHPEDALDVYQRLVPSRIGLMNNGAYKEAAGWVRKIGILFKRLGKEKEWNTYLNALRTDYKRKRNFMTLLDEIR